MNSPEILLSAYSVGRVSCLVPGDLRQIQTSGTYLLSSYLIGLNTVNLLGVSDRSSNEDACLF